MKSVVLSLDAINDTLTTINSTLETISMKLNSIAIAGIDVVTHTPEEVVKKQKNSILTNDKTKEGIDHEKSA